MVPHWLVVDHSEGDAPLLRLVRLLRFLADQASESRQAVLGRYDRKPKRVATRRLFVLQGLPGIGPALARRLLVNLGSVERVMTADTATLRAVRGVGPKKAACIRELVSGQIHNQDPRIRGCR